MSGLPYDCEAVLDKLDAYHQGELSPEETEAFTAHLARCRKCLCIEQHEQAFLARLRAAGRDCCPEALRERILKLCGDPGCRGE
ncbi:MAG: zf-HC2 domain-containing protein [Gemmatimonadota bacterium]